MNSASATIELSGPPAGGPAPRLRTFNRWFGKHTVWAAWLALTLAVALPPSGVGFSLCWLRGILEIPCPGCGLTRSLSCALRGRLYESWQFHPFGPFVLVLFLAVAVVSLLPEAKRARLASAMEGHAQFFQALFVVFVTAFCSYGLLRALLQLAGVCQFAA